MTSESGARRPRVAPSRRAPKGHDQTRENFQSFLFSQPVAAAGRQLADLQRKVLSQVKGKVELRLPQVESRRNWHFSLVWSRPCGILQLWAKAPSPLRDQGAANEGPRCAVPMHDPKTSSPWRALKEVGSSCEVGCWRRVRPILKACPGVGVGLICCCKMSV